MGTTCLDKSAEETRKYLLKLYQWDRPNGTYSHVLGSAKGSGGFWILTANRWQYKDEPLQDAVEATFIRMTYAKGSTYVKDLSIEGNPPYYDCPKDWLDQITPCSQWGKEWLENARSHLSKEQKISKGMKFQYWGNLYEVVEYFGGGSWVVEDKHSGSHQRFKMKSQNIRESLMLV